MTCPPSGGRRRAARPAAGRVAHLSCDLDPVPGPSRGRRAGSGRGGMRSIWRGAVSFGLVSIGVKLYSATEDKDIRFHQVHATDGGRVKYKRVCSIDGEEVEYSDIAKGYELPDGQVVILTDEDFDDLPLTHPARDRGPGVRRPGRDRPDHVREDLLPRARRPGRPALRAAARRPGERRAGRDHQDRHPAARVARGAARARRRARAAHHAVARRDPPSRLRLPRRGHRRPAAGAEDGRGADRLDDRRVRPEPVHRRLPRGHDGAARGQAERRRGRSRCPRCPTTAPRSST